MSSLPVSGIPEHAAAGIVGTQKCLLPLRTHCRLRRARHFPVVASNVDDLAGLVDDCVRKLWVGSGGDGQAAAVGENGQAEEKCSAAVLQQWVR